MDTMFSQILNMSLTGSVVILCILAARLVLKRAPKVFSYALWSVVLFRLLCPVSLPSPVSLLEMFQPEVTESTGITSSVSYLPVRYVPAEEPLVELQGIAEQEIPQAVPADVQRSVPLLTIGAYLWLAGAAVMVLYSAVSYLRLRRRLVGATPWREEIYLADHIDSPFVMGIARPRIYMPSSVPMKERRYIVAHERHHIRRGDHIIKLLAYGALCIHWFNPLVWIAFIQAGKDMEMSCDEAVINKLGPHIRADYSASLLRLATHRRIIAGAPLAFGEGDTKGRVMNMAKWKKPRFWVSAVCAVVCIAVLAACAGNPLQETAEVTESLVQIQELPAGYTYETDENQNILFTDGTNTVGGVICYPIPEGVYDPDDDWFDWLFDLGIPDFEDSSLCYTGGISDFQGGWIAEFVSDVPEGEEVSVDRRHNLRVVGDSVYDIWCDMKLLSMEIQQEIVNAVEFSNMGGDQLQMFLNSTTDVGFGDLYFKLPKGYAVETEESEEREELYDIFFTDGTNIIGGAEDYPVPEFDLIMSGEDLSKWNYEEWLAALRLEDAQDETLARMGGSSKYGDHEEHYFSDVPEGETVTVDRCHTFFIAEDRVYDIWFDMLLTESTTMEEILKTAYLDDGTAADKTVIVGSTIYTDIDINELTAFEKCGAVFEAVQSGSCQISSVKVNEGNQGPSGYGTKYCYHDGDWLYISEMLLEGVNLTDAGAYSQKQAYMAAHDTFFSNEGYWGEPGDIVWKEGEEKDIPAPKLASFVWGTWGWKKSNVTYMDMLTDENGVCIMYRIDKMYADIEGYSDSYFANFYFDEEGNFLEVRFQVNQSQDNAFTVIERIVSLDDETVAAEIDKEYQRAIG